MKPTQSLTTIYKQLSLYAQKTVAITPHQGNFSLQQRSMKNTITNQKAELWIPVPVDTSLKHSCILISGNIVEEKAEWLWKPQDWGICRNIVSPIAIRSYIHKVSTIWPLKCELNKDDTNECTEVDREQPMGSELCTEVHATEESWERERWPHPGKNTPIGCPTSNGHIRSHS